MIQIFLGILLTMNAYVPSLDANYDWDIWNLILVEDEDDVKGLDRMLCGPVWSGCYSRTTHNIYVIGTNGCNLWHEIWHASGHIEHYNYCDWI